MFTLLTASLIAFLACLLLTPILRMGLLRLGFVDRHEKRGGAVSVPRMGGLSVLVATGLGLAAPLFLHLHGGSLIHAVVPMIRELAGPVVLVLFLGIADDAFGVSPLFKVMVQLVAAGWLVRNGLGIPALLGHAFGPVLSAVVTVVWLLGCTNAFNLIDGLDGLASGEAIFATGTVLIYALLNHYFALAVLTAALTGALAAFLHYNFYPASIFLGDAGSLPIGFLLGSFALFWADKATTLISLSAPLFALAVPLFDTGIAISRRWLAHRPLFGRDQGHVHHKLLQRGLTVHRSVLLLYAAGLFGAAASLLLTTFRQQQYSGIVILFFAFFVWGGIQQLGYTEFAEAARIWRRGFFEQRKIIRMHVRMRSLLANVDNLGDINELWAVLAAVALCLHFSALELRVGGEQNPYWFRRKLISEEDSVPGARAEAADAVAVPAAPVMPLGWSLRVPLGQQGELGLLSFWRAGDSHYPLATLQVVEDLKLHVSRSLEQYLNSLAARPEHALAAVAGCGAELMSE